jgi:DNA segregation ATPase FtsK/SpoIIIE, S-DNA-T family
MTTWGPSKKKTARSRSSATPPAAPTSGSSGRAGGAYRAGGRPPASGRKTTGGRAAVSSDTPPATPRGRQATNAELREAVGGREHELVGIALIVGGIVIALALYFHLAGPLGRAVELLVGWMVGLGRFVIPVALIAAGVSLVRRGQSSSPVRLAIGWGLAWLALEAFAHVINGPDEFSDWDNLYDSGGLVGAVVGAPLKALLSPVGAGVVFIGIAIGGALLVTQTSLRTMAERTGRGVGNIARPAGRAARQALRDLSSLSSDRDDDDVLDATAVDGARPGEPRLLPPPTVYDAADDFADAPPAPRARRSKSTAATPPAPGPGDQLGAWTLPPASYLVRTGAQTINRAEVEARGRVLQESLAQHGVDTSLVGMTVGPTVTRYELELGPGVKVARVTSLQRDIAYAMAAVDVRILAPIPGRSAIGVEVPNHTRQLVALGDLLAAPEATVATGPLEVAVGKDIAGKAVFLDLATTPHLLIAGATGAGKSSGINCIITSLLMRTTPDQVRLILIDPKQVEMGQYNRLPHLLTQPVTNPKKAANALGWAVKEMERRYDLLSEVGFRDVGGYNAAFDRGELSGASLDGADGGDDPLPPRPADAHYERLPYIVVVVDELNDLMMVAARDVEESITRIAQKARAVGIHLIVATQRPSVNVITGVIKANIPARMAFAVSSLTDSRVILDQPGAEKLVGKGDMLLLPGNSSVAQRIQGSFVGEEEVRKVVAHWRRQAPEVAYVSGVDADGGGGAGGSDGEDHVTASANAFSAGSDDDDEAMVRQAMELVVRSQLGSTSMLQRKLKVGFARAGRIMDLLEQRGVVGPSEGSKARAVLMTVEELELLQQAERDR